ncbi:hypothetical protein NKR19_g7523 [Coniochaeta hoffmannii]|uniref:Copper homeostasis protein cutC homolog n=1 Tax=Coniochaeta hoffmannii TaxID=91930 RepID=A0AA38R765_9PEZI|nr:hypothetical protein NKR19_g7523 [Coniochaeta hoffmannii]
MSNGRTILEVPIFNRTSVLPAIAAGCRRVELNATGSYPVGGTTPSLELVRDVLCDLDSLPFPVPLRVMIRPSGGDFVYIGEEQSLIRTSIEQIKPLLRAERGDGFVFGALRPARENGLRRVDWRLCERVVGWCEPLPVVCHRAFDEAVETDEPVEMGMARLAVRVGGVGFKGLLTSGGPGNAGDNLPVLRGIVEEIGGTMEVVVGGGVRSGNVVRRLMSTRSGGSWAFGRRMEIQEMLGKRNRQAASSEDVRLRTHPYLRPGTMNLRLGNPVPSVIASRTVGEAAGGIQG